MTSGWTPSLATGHGAGRFEDGAHLHPGDLGIDDPEPAAAKAEHRVHLAHVLDQALDVLRLLAHLLRQRRDFLLVLGKELVERRVEQPDGDGEAFHRAEDSLEVAALHRQQLVEGALPARLVLGEDHLADCGDPVALEEHVLGPAEADPLGAEIPALVGIGRRVGIHTDAEVTELVGPGEQPVVVAVERRGLERRLPDEHPAGAAVQRDPVAFLDRAAVDREAHGLFVNLHLLRAGDAGLAHATRHDGCVRCHAAARGEDRARHDHAVKVLRAGFRAHEDDGFALFAARLGDVRARTPPSPTRRRVRRADPS